jgi:pyruvate, water dikinase
LYLLQGRAQNPAKYCAPAPIPRDLPRERLIFTANRHVSNGYVPSITHIVYVDPEKYSQLDSLDQLVAVGRAVGKLNKVLPKRQFVLMGPGRWGSRGDIKLGVRVTYSDINNSALLVEIARKKGDYTPDLSFGTHFFQDLVEGAIRYLPLYPDEEGVVFNEPFLTRSGNILADLAPEYSSLSDTVYVIDVPRAADGQVLRVLMNADIDEAVGVLVPPSTELPSADEIEALHEPQRGQDWRWRYRMAERIAAELDPDRFGVQALYLIGSVKNATAGPASDIDIIVHFRGTPAEREAMELWLNGWSVCLSEMNYLRTGYKTTGLLDTHIVTDEDIASRTSFAVKIDAVTDPARRLPLGKRAADTSQGR